MKVMIENSNKAKCKTMLRVIKILVLDFILYFIPAYMRNYM